MKNILIGSVLLAFAGSMNAAPVVYTSEFLFRADLAALGFSVIHESFEDDVVWADSRNSIPNPGSTPSVTSKGMEWTSNYAANDIATGDVGGSAPDGTYAIYSLPHGNTTDSGLYCDSAEEPDIPIECYQNDGLKIRSADGGLLYAFGGRVDTANNGKITFLLDGADINASEPDNIDNWQREGEPADNWAFVGVIDTEGFQTAELRELRGKDYQQVLLFADDFSIGVAQDQQPVAGTVAGMYLGFAYCKDLTNASTAQDPVPGFETSWNCTDNGLVVNSGDTAIALVSGVRLPGPDPVGGTLTGISPQVAICTNLTTAAQAFVPLGGSGNWDCTAAGLASDPGDAVRVILFGTVQ